MIKELIQTKCPTMAIPFIVYAATLLCSCKQHGYGSPEGYNLEKPKLMQLGKVLNEISGLTYDESSGNLLAISDSKEKVFEIKLKNNKLKDLTGKVVPSGSDLEDLVKVDNTVYLLASKGIITAVSPGAQDTTGLKTYGIGLSGHNDFETLYYDPTVDGLVMMCKTCSHEKGHHIRTAYRFDLKTRQFDTSALYTITKSSIEDVLKDNDIKFDPSGAAINPINKRLYILSSAGNLMVIADTRGKVIQAFKLNPDKFPQAEGIAFAPNGDMYISNEGKEGKPTLLLFPYSESKKNK
jgi:hypothetical protein